MLLHLLADNTGKRALFELCEQMGGEGEAREKHKTQEIRRYQRM